jgi:hypothetical protein
LDFWTGLDLGFCRIFLGVVQRRGGRVNTPEIGSRDGVLCIGGILGIHADLRRETFWGNFNWDFFGVLLVVPREACEEGGPLCVPFVRFGGILG